MPCTRHRPLRSQVSIHSPSHQPHPISPQANGDHTWVVGTAKWFNRLSNQILAVKGDGGLEQQEASGKGTSALEMGPLVPVRVDESLKLVDVNESQVGVEEFEALVVDGIVQWADPDAGMASTPAGPAAEPTPQELLRSQVCTLDPSLMTCSNFATFHLRHLDLTPSHQSRRPLSLLVDCSLLPARARLPSP